MPDRREVMHAAEEYLEARESGRASRSVASAKAIGLLLLSLGILFSAAFLWSNSIAKDVLLYIGLFFFVTGIPLLVLGFVGTAKYRATEFTRYPQQTGEPVDSLLQLLGERFVWIVIAMAIIWILVFALLV